MAVVLIGTLDTKGQELQFVRDQIREEGLATCVVDAGVTRPPAFPPDVPREDVFKAAGITLEAVQKKGDRGDAITLAALGAAKLIRQWHAEGKVDGVLSLGGSAGTTIGTAAMRALPIGVPKIMVSTLASGQVKPYVGVRDIMMIYSVVDISGINRISRPILTNAAQAMIGMVKSMQAGKTMGAAQDKPVITATMFGVTTPCVEKARELMEAKGFEMLVFHATGSGGQTMEGLIQDGLVQGVLDFTTTELADELVGGILSAGPDRLTAASLRGIPQVISVGALDMVNFGTPDSVPSQFKERRFYQHNPTVTLMRTTPEENDQLGKEIAHKASASKGPVAILLPLKGVSAIDAEGKPFWWPEADQALFDSIRLWKAPHVRLIEMEVHINDPAFAAEAVRTLLDFMK